MSIVRFITRLPWWVWAAGPAGVGVALIATPAQGSTKPPHPAEKGKSATPPPPPGGDAKPTIKQGSKGAAVKEWQTLIGITPADGVFGPGTHAATKAWQGSHGLTADGVVGPKTWAAAMGAPGAPPSMNSSLLGAPTSGSSGRDWALSLPKNATKEREQAVIDAVASGFFAAPDMVPVTYQKDGHTVTIFAWADCLAIGLTDPIRVSLNHVTAQKIADKLGLMLPTTRMSDAAYQAATGKLNPQVIAQNKLPVMSTTTEMIAHSDRVETAKQKAGQAFVRDTGKDWVNSERLLTPSGQPATPGASTIGAGGGKLPASANFGWHSNAAPLKSPGGMSVYQSVGLAHDCYHADYSQVLTLYGKQCEVDGFPMSVEMALKSPDFAYLLSDEVQKGKTARVWRYPGLDVPGVA